MFPSTREQCNAAAALDLITGFLVMYQIKQSPWAEKPIKASNA